MKSLAGRRNCDEKPEPDLKYIKHIICQLVNPYSQYYSNGYLNSEGLTLINNLAKHIVKFDVSLKNLIQKVRKVKSYEYVVKLIDEISRKLSLTDVKTLCIDEQNYSTLTTSLLS